MTPRYYRKQNKLFAAIHVRKQRAGFFALLLPLLAVGFLGQLIPLGICYDFSIKRPAIGVKKIAAIAVQFPDKPVSSTINDLRQRIFVEMNAYYQNVSYGKMSIAGDIIGAWIHLTHEMSYYGNYSGMSDDSEGTRALIKDALVNSQGLMNFSQFDYVLVIHVGQDEAYSKNSTDIWSHGFWDGLSASTEDGKIFDQGAVVSEFDELGTFCHEFGHILGLPDLYNIDKNSTKVFVGNWDLMGTGSYNGDPEGSKPAQISSWGKTFLGWIDDSQIAQFRLDRSLNLTIEPLEIASGGTKVVRIDIAPKFYYLIEARIDENLPEQGVLITRINETRNSGEGIVEVVDAHNSTENLFDAAFHVDDYFEETQHLFTVKVLESDKSSSTVQISNKLVPHTKVVMPDEVEAYQDARIEARIVAYNSTPLQGLVTTLFINGERQQSLVTDANGTVVYVFNFDLLSTGKKSIMLTIAGNDYFMDGQFSQTLNITIPWWFYLPTLAAFAGILIVCVLHFRSRMASQLSKMRGRRTLL
jgi:M6 family metalloprotease-like protein